MQNPIKYTTSVLNDTVDLVKKIIYYFDLCIQLFFIGNLGYKIYFSAGYMIPNIVLLAISLIALIHFFATTKEFYTKEEKKSKKKTKTFIKIFKRLTNLAIITLSILDLTKVSNINSNIDILSTLILIGGFVVNVIFDCVIMVIDRRLNLVETAFLMDVIKFKGDHPKITTAIKLVTDIEVFEEEVTVKETLEEKVKVINFHQECKNKRKKEFKTKNGIKY